MHLFTTAAALLSLITIALLPPGTQANPVPQTIEPTTGYRSCPTGATYQRIEEYFSSYNQTSWQLVKGPEGATFGREGARLDVSGMTGEVVLQSTSRFAAPLTISVDIKTDATPGVASAIFFGTLDGGDEVDLELCKGQFMTPLWRAGGAGKSQRLSIGTEVSEQLLGGTRRKTNLIETYGYQYDGFKPRSWQTYKMDWSTDRIVWSVGGTERVAYTKQTFLPSGPLPIRLGPWRTSGFWCGQPASDQTHSTMLVRRLIIEGCVVG